jgi:hypothetical protein
LLELKGSMLGFGSDLERAPAAAIRRAVMWLPR